MDILSELFSQFKYYSSRFINLSSRFKYLLSRSNIIFLAAIFFGIVLPQAAIVGAALTIPAIIIILTITPLKIPPGFFRRPGRLVPSAIRGIVMSYLLLGNLIIFIGIFFGLDVNLWIGLVLIAAAPPAIAILSLSNLLKADQTLSIAGLGGAYLGALLIIPLILLGFVKDIPLTLAGIFLIVFELIFIPLALSRIIVDKDWDKIVKPYEGIIIDVCFFVVFYTITASNRDILADWPSDLSYILIIAFLIIFLAAFIILNAGKFFRTSENKITSLLLLGTMKNYTLAGGIALIIFDRQAALPALIFAAVNFIYINWLKYIKRDTVPETKKKPARNKNLTR
jgi:BASS family bile acid:Na+ symporter